MNTIAKTRAGLALGIVLCLAVLAQHNDQVAQRAEAVRIADARAQMAGRGVCGTGGELALLREGYACLHRKPDGMVTALAVFDSPIQLAAGRP